MMSNTEMILLIVAFLMLVIVISMGCVLFPILVIGWCSEAAIRKAETEGGCRHPALRFDDGHPEYPWVCGVCGVRITDEEIQKFEVNDHERVGSVHD